MLEMLCKITCSCWLIVLSANLLLLLIKNIKFLTALRLSNIVLSFLTLCTGLAVLITQQKVIITIPWLFFGFHPQLNIDALSGFFIMLSGVSYLAINSFSIDYYKHYNFKQQCNIQVAMIFFEFAILLVFLANDPLLFLFAWELMAVISYFLIVSLEPGKLSRKAGLLHLSFAHISFITLAISFFLLFSHLDISRWYFYPIAQSWQLTQATANGVFLLTLIGFGAKAGFFPLHIWMPEAYPAAPSPISALMSGVMLKTAFYGLLKFIFVFLLTYQQQWWGYSLITIGLITMLMGVIHAAMQIDMKRLLAYSSMENSGLICTALGLSIVFFQHHQFVIADLALLVVFLHCLNHSIFKSLLFLGTGSVLHATGEHRLGKLGGLIQKMPWVSACTLIATLAMAGLPLFNGFISEWLYLSIFFHNQGHTQFLLATFSPIIIAISVLVFGLSGFVIVKFYGITFLGQAREPAILRAHRSGFFEKAGLLWLALLCLLLGVWPNPIISLIQKMISQLSPRLQIHTITANTSQYVTANMLSTTGFNPLNLALSLLILLVMTWLLIRRYSTKKIRRAISWSCGFGPLSPRMQDTAEGFSQPFKQIFANLIMTKLHLAKTDKPQLYYHVTINERIWSWFYFPLVKLTTRAAALTRLTQQGQMSAYLLYIGLTLFALLSWVIWR